MAAELKWIKSSYTDEGNCVECASDGRAVRVRDSKDRDESIEVALATWNAFLAAVRV